MIANMEKISQRLKDLTRQSQQLGKSLRQSAMQLQDDGIVPKLSLIAEIQSYQKQLHEENQSIAKESGAKPTPVEQVTLETLRQGMEQLQVRQRAIEVLDLIPRIVHREDDKFLPLQECNTVASILKENLQSVTEGEIHPEIQTVIDGKHPLCALLELVQTPDTLNDETWSRHNELITTAFGRQLSTAVARGKLKMYETKEETKQEKGKKGNRLHPQKKEIKK